MNSSDAALERPGESYEGDACVAPTVPAAHEFSIVRAVRQSSTVGAVVRGRQNRTDPAVGASADTVDGKPGSKRPVELAIFPVLLVVLSIFALAPLFHPLYFWGAHDARHSVYFLVEFDRSIQDGILYPRWAPDFTFGYGYPIFNIYAPLAYYLGEVFHLVGFGFVESVKVVFGLGIVLSGLTMYLFARDFFGPRGALVAGLVYIYVPYRIVDIYVRGALAESLSFVFFPLVLWALRRVAFDHRARNVILASLSLAGLILANNTIALLFLPLVIGYCLWLIVIERRGSLHTMAFDAGWMIAAGALALGLSAIFWLPMVVENGYVRTDQWTTAYYDYRSHFVYLYQLFSPFWGFGISKAGPGDEMPFQLGAVAVVLAMVGLWLVRSPSSLFFALTTLIAIFLMLPASAGLWDALRIAVFVQFPWRLLAVTAFSLAFLAGGVVVGEKRGMGSFAGLVALLAIVVLGSYPYLTAQFIEPAEGSVSLGGLMRFQQSSGELVGLTRWNQEKPTDSPLMPLYVAGKPIASKVAPESIPAGGSAETIRRTTTLEEVRVKTPGDFRMTFYTQSYPGWKAYVDGKPTETEPTGKLGLISLNVPAGEHDVLLRFETTMSRVLGTLISGLALSIVVAWTGLRLWRRRIDR